MKKKISIHTKQQQEVDKAKEIKSECDGCGKITMVSRHGEFRYCKKCFEEVMRGN